MKTFLVLLFTLTLCPLMGQAQATTGWHRVNQVLAREPSGGVNAQVVPYATIQVVSTATGGAATIYRDPLLSSQISPPVVTADENGNYSYYLPLNYCVTENVSSPGSGGVTTPNICGNTGGGITGPGTAGYLSVFTGTQTIGNSLVDYGVTTTGHLTFGAESDFPSGLTGALTGNVTGHASLDLGLAGGTLTGPLNTPLTVNKTPRVDITHPDFGGTQTYASSLSSAYNETWTSGSVTYNGTTATFTCTNAADRTGSNDSGCAAASAVAYATTQCTLNACPSIYVPHGTFKISNVLRIPSNLSIIGDGPQASVLQTTSPTANLLTFVGSVNPLAFFFGGVMRNIGLSGSGHTTTGTLLEEQGAPLTIDSVLFYNHGGKGFVGFENTERTKMSDIQFLQVRQPEVIDGYEYRQSNVTIGSAGCAADNYCFGVNDINGVFPGPLPAADYTLVSATGSGSSAAFVFSGSQTGYAAGISPLAVGNVLAVAGITSVTGLNSPSNQGWQVSAVANNSPSSGEFTLTVGATPLGQQISASGSGNISAATFSTVLLPDNRHASIWISGGYNNSLLGGEIKPTTHLPAFKIMIANALEIDNFYVEGYIDQVQPGLLFSGLPEQMIANGTLQASSASACISGGFPCISVTPATAQWWPETVGQAADISNLYIQGLTIYVFPCDYVANSTSPSACNSSVQQGQWEIVRGAAALDTGLFYLTARNQTGSTAPANTVWVNPVLEGAAPAGLSTGNGLTTRNNEWSSNVATLLPSGYSAYAADGTIYQEAEAETSMDDGYIHYAGGWGTAGTNIGAQAQWHTLDSWPHFQPESLGENWIKNNSLLGLDVPYANPLTYFSGAETVNVGALPGSLSANLTIPQVNNNVNSYMQLTSPAGNWNSGQAYGPYFTQPVDASSPAGLGNNPGGSGLYMGNQFWDSSCSADTGTTKATFKISGISGTTMTVASVTAGAIVADSLTPLFGSGLTIASGTTITGETGPLTYTVSVSQTVGAGSVSEGHAQSRFCLAGFENTGGAAARWDLWNGSSWTPQFQDTSAGFSTPYFAAGLASNLLTYSTTINSTNYTISGSGSTLTANSTDIPPPAGFSSIAKVVLGSYPSYFSTNSSYTTTTGVGYQDCIVAATASGTFTGVLAPQFASTSSPPTITATTTWQRLCTSASTPIAGNPWIIAGTGTFYVACTETSLTATPSPLCLATQGSNSPTPAANYYPNFAILNSSGQIPAANLPNIVPQVGTPTVNQAACIKSAGPPVVIGYCSTVVGAGGACTCN